MKFTKYFELTKQRPDRAQIDISWIKHVCENPEFEFVQTDGRIRRWAKIIEMDSRFLRVVLLEDGETVHNAFFDRRFKL